MVFVHPPHPLSVQTDCSIPLLHTPQLEVPPRAHLTCRYKLTAPFLWGQEGIYKYSAADGSTFQFTLFLLVVECALNVAVAVVGASAAGLTPGLPQEMFALTGATQIAAKFFTNAAMASGVSFPTQVPRRPPPARGRHSCGLS